MIEVRDLVKTYGFRDGHVVLDQVSLTVPKGSIFGILGPVGAGKTTLLRIMATALLPSSGDVTVGDFGLPQDAGQARRLLALAPERGYFGSWDNAWDYLRFWAQVAGLSGPQAKDRIAELTAFLELENPKDLSLEGPTVEMETRLNLAQALLTDPEVLFLDEPLTGVPRAGQEALVKRLKDLQARGKTIVLTSPHLEDIRGACDWVAVLEAGRVLGVLKTPDLLELIGRGRHARIFVETDAPTDALDPIKPLEGVVSAKVARDVVVVFVNPGVVNPSKVEKALKGAGVPVTSVRQAEITLGDVFRALHERGGS